MPGIGIGIGVGVRGPSASGSASVGGGAPKGISVRWGQWSSQYPGRTGNPQITLTVTNHEDSAHGVSITVVASDPGIDFSSATQSAGTWNGSVWNFTLAIGATETLTFTGVTSTQFNTPEILVADLTAPLPFVRSVNSPFIKWADVDVEISVVVEDDQPGVGGDVTLKFDAVNNGPDAASGLVAQLTPAPPGVTYKSVTVNEGTYDPATGIWQGFVLPTTQTALMDVVATMDQDVQASTTLSLVSVNEKETDTGNNDAKADYSATVPPWSPADIPGLQAWYESRSGVTEEVDGVSQWDDLSGNGKHWVMATGSKRPQVVTNTDFVPSGAPVLDFDRVDDELNYLAGLINTTGPATVVFLFNRQTEGVYSMGDNTLNASHRGVRFENFGGALYAQQHSSAQWRAMDDSKLRFRENAKSVSNRCWGFIRRDSDNLMKGGPFGYHSPENTPQDTGGDAISYTCIGKWAASGNSTTVGMRYCAGVLVFDQAVSAEDLRLLWEYIEGWTGAHCPGLRDASTADRTFDNLGDIQLEWSARHAMTDSGGSVSSVKDQAMMSPFTADDAPSEPTKLVDEFGPGLHALRFTGTQNLKVEEGSANMGSGSPRVHCALIRVPSGLTGKHAIMSGDTVSDWTGSTFMVDCDDDTIRDRDSIISVPNAFPRDEWCTVMIGRTYDGNSNTYDICEVNRVNKLGASPGNPGGMQLERIGAATNLQCGLDIGAVAVGRLGGSGFDQDVFTSLRFWQAQCEDWMIMAGIPNFGVLGDLSLWYESRFAGDINEEVDGVDSWRNRGDRANATFDQNTGANRPQLTPDHFGAGVPAITFDAVDDILTATSAAAEAGEFPFYLAFVVDWEQDWGNNRVRLVGGGSNAEFGFHTTNSGGTFYGQRHGGLGYLDLHASPLSTEDAEKPHILEAWANPGETIKCRLNGVDIGPGELYDSIPQTNNMGSRDMRNVATAGVQNYGAFLYYRTLPDQATRNYIRDTLASLYNITLEGSDNP